jgi:hypothetical protein
VTTQKASTSGRGSLLKQQTVAFGREPVSVPAGSVPARPPAVPAPGSLEGEPHVQLHRDDDGSVRAITVRCSCGREITLQCEYLDDGGANER